MLIATGWLVGALAVLWVVVRTTDGLARYALLRGARDRPRLVVLLWALFLLPGALVRLLFRVLTARLLGVPTTRARLRLPRRLDPDGGITIDDMEIAPTDVVRESAIETASALAGGLGVLGAAMLAGFRLAPQANGDFLRDLPAIIVDAFRQPNLARAVIGTYLLVAVSTATARPGPLGRRHRLVTLIAPALLVFLLLALGAWPLSEFPPVILLARALRAMTQALILAALLDSLLLALTLLIVQVRRRSTKPATRGPTGTAPLRTADAPTAPVPHRE